MLALGNISEFCDFSRHNCQLDVLTEGLRLMRRWGIWIGVADLYRRGDDDIRAANKDWDMRPDCI